MLRKRTVGEGVFGLILCLLFACSAFGQGAFVSGSAQGTINGSLRSLPGATVTVCAANTTGIPCSPPLANTLFKDQALTQPLANPTTTDTNGNYNFAVAAGTYTLTITATGFTGSTQQITVTCGTGGCTASSLTVTGATTLGSLTVNGTQTNTGATTINQPNGYIFLVNNDATYPCTGPGLSAAITAAASSGHVVDATNCTGTISPASGLTISVNNVTILFGSQTWSFPLSVTAPFTVNGTGVVFQCRPQQTIFTMAALGTSPTGNVNLFVFFGNNDEINDCTLQGQATNNASNFQVAINFQANNQKGRRNTITGIDGTHGFNWGFGVQGTVSGHYIEQNIISQIMTKADGQGFGIVTGTSPSQGFIRANNINFNTGGQLPIYLSTATQNFEVSDNVIIGGGTNQIKFNSITTGAVAAVSYNNVHNNILSGCTTCATGVGLIYVTANSPHNKIHDNIIIGATGNTSSGITLDAAGSTVGTPDFNEIENNKIELTGEYGILIIGANKNILNGNKIRNVSQQTAGQYDGIRIQGDGGSNGSNANSVINNQVQDGSFRSPLYITSTIPVPTNTFVAGNIFPSANGGIQDQGTGTQYGMNMLNTTINGTGANVNAAPSGYYVGGQNSSGTGLPTQVMTASGQFFGAVGNTVALTADWTCGTGGTVASCVAATIIGSGGGVPLTFTLPSVAQSYTLSCDGVVGQATAATLNQWNLLTATNGATNVTANYTMATAATAYAAGAVTDTASTTTTFQITPSWTLGGTGTKMPFHVWAKIEGASASGTVVSLQLVAPTVADLVTIYRGTACTIF